MSSKCFGRTRTVFHSILLREYSRQTLRSRKPNYRNRRAKQGHDVKETPKLTTDNRNWRIGKQLLFSVGFGFCVYSRCTLDQAVYLCGDINATESIVPKVYELFQIESFMDEFSKYKLDTESWTIFRYNKAPKESKNIHDHVATNISIFVCLTSLAGLVLKRVGFKVFNKMGIAPNNAFYSPFTCLCLHGSLFHLAVNIYAFNNFKPDPKDVMNQFQLPAFLVAAGLTSSMVAVIWKSLTKSIIPSVGASGAIYAMVFYQLFRHPDTRYSLVFAREVTFTSMTIASLAVCVELMIMTIMSKKSPFDHACHIGGMLFGYLYYRYLEELWWTKPVKKCRKELEYLKDIINDI